MKKLIFAVFISLFFIMGCEDDTVSTRDTKVDFIDPIVTTLNGDYYRYTSRIGNEGSKTVFAITVWVMSHDINGDIIDYDTWSYPDSLYPNTSVEFDHTVYSVEASEVEATGFDIEWREP